MKRKVGIWVGPLVAILVLFGIGLGAFLTRSPIYHADMVEEKALEAAQAAVVNWGGEEPVTVVSTYRVAEGGHEMLYGTMDANGVSYAYYVPLNRLPLGDSYICEVDNIFVMEGTAETRDSLIHVMSYGLCFSNGLRLNMDGTLEFLPRETMRGWFTVTLMLAAFLAVRGIRALDKRFRGE